MNRKAFNRINYGLFIVAAAARWEAQWVYRQLPASGDLFCFYKFSLTVNKSNRT